MKKNKNQGKCKFFTNFAECVPVYLDFLCKLSPEYYEVPEGEIENKN